MRKMHKIINIALIFTLIGVFLCQNIAYSSDISYLRVPVGDSERIKQFLNDKEKRIALSRLYYEFYGTEEIPEDVLNILLPAIVKGDLHIKAIKEVLLMLKESLSLKPQMSEALASDMVNFLSIANPGRSNPITMTSKGRYGSMFRYSQSDEFMERYPVFKNGGEGHIAMEIGLGFPMFSTAEWKDVWQGEMIGMDRELPDTLLMFKGEDRKTGQEVTLYVLLEKSGDMGFKLKNWTVNCNSERVLVMLQNELTRNINALEKVFSTFTKKKYKEHMRNGRELTDLDEALTVISQEDSDLSELEEYLKVDSMGIVDQPYSTLEQKYPDIEIIKGDAFDDFASVLGNRRVDVIRIQNVLMYSSIEKREKFMQEALRALNDNGVLIETIASPNGGEFITILYVKSDNKLIKSETVVSPTIFTRPLWPIYDKRDSCIKEQIELLKAINRNRQPYAATPHLISKDAITSEQLEIMIQRKLMELKEKVRIEHSEATEKKEKDQLLRIEIFKYLESVPYQSISGELDPVYGPAQILAGWGGMCNAKTFVAGLLFSRAGYEVKYYYMPFNWFKQAKIFLPKKLRKKYKQNYNILLSLAKDLARVPYLHQFLKVSIDGKFVTFDATWDKAIADVLQDGFTRSWDGNSDMGIAVKGMNNNKYYLAKSTPSETAELINRTYERYDHDPESFAFNEKSRLLLRALSDLFWWLRGPEMIKDISFKGSRVVINPVGAISRIYDRPSPAITSTVPSIPRNDL